MCLKVLLIFFIGLKLVLPIKEGKYVCINYEYSTELLKINKKSTYPMTKARPIEVCCEGSILINDECVKICSPACIHGECTEENVCKCDPGYMGLICDKECESHRYGPSCLKRCECQNDSLCDRFTGECECTPGWTGRKCQKKCPPGKFGANCKETCSCLNGSCNHVTGECLCDPGYFGPLCDKICPKGTHGNNCTSFCNCQHGDCNKITGACECDPGWTGPITLR